MVSIIVAVSDNGVIGDKGSMPWNVPDDLKRFKQLTIGNVVIMGRKTYDSIGKPLPDRLNIIISRDKKLKIPECIVVDSITKAIKKAGNDKEIFIIGGGEIYKNSIIFADTIFMTQIFGEYDGDTTFPTLTESEWNKVLTEEKETHRFVMYKRKVM